MQRVVLDVNVLVSALITPRGPCARLVLEVTAGAFELVTSPLLLAELEDALFRDKFRRYVSEDEATAFIDMLRQESLLVEDPVPSPTPWTADPDDEYLIALALEYHADFLVSGDPHLTRLRGVLPVLTPREFLDLLSQP